MKKNKIKISIALYNKTGWEEYTCDYVIFHVDYLYLKNNNWELGKRDNTIATFNKKDIYELIIE